ncbi:LVIVD repeat-containing protein [Saliphagus sp. LR7]|uniref:LVIVD repeat-containing protein n=1 Tax=Saliphagus sp. LR7 TaxID=2282654 RepID=UPI001E2F7B85|nr:hypothetical protein [Saliphagus sp. LR7]
MDLSRRTLLASVPASATAAGLGSRPVTGNGVQADWEPLGRLRLTGAAEAVVSDGTAYVATVDGFAVVDLADPAGPELLAERRGLRVADGDLLEGDGANGDVGGNPSDPTGGGENDASEDGDGDDAGTAESSGNDTAGEDGDPESNDTAGAGTADAGEALTEILDLSVAGDRLVVPGPANPARDVFTGFALYDVSDPADPEPLATHETDFHIHNSTLHEGYCYLVGNDGERNPLVIVDVSGDEPREVGRWSLLDHEPRWADVDPFLWYLHDVTLSDDIAVLAYWNAGTYLVDVSDPTSPSYVGHVAETDVEAQLEVPATGVTEAQQTLPGNDHHARLAGDLLAVGREAWAAEAGDPEGSGGIDLYDASDRPEIDHLATIEAPPTEDASYAAGEWTTSHNFSLRDGRLYASWYRGGVSVHDVSEPANPAEIARFEDRERAAFWTAHAADGIVVAPSTPLVPNAPTEGALYTFPASLEGESTDSEDGAAGTENETETDAEGDEEGAGGDDAGTEAEGGGSNGEGETDDGENGTDAPPEEGNESAADADGGNGLPSLEIGAAVTGGVAAGGAAVLAWLRLRGSGGASEDAGDR